MAKVKKISTGVFSMTVTHDELEKMLTGLFAAAQDPFFSDPERSKSFMSLYAEIMDERFEAGRLFEIEHRMEVD